MNRLDVETIKQYDIDYLFHSWQVQPKKKRTVIVKAEGVFLWDSDGKRYYDMASQSTSCNIGHANKKVQQAMKDQIDTLIGIGPAFACEAKSALAKRVLDIAPDNMGKVFFTLGGSDANENAIKIARMYTGKAKIFSRYRSYHGGTAGAGNASGDRRRFANEIGGCAGFVKFDAPYLYREEMKFDSEEEASAYYMRRLRKQIEYENPDNIAAIIIESVTGSSGLFVPPQGYMQGLRELCDEFGILLICDEVMAGFGRTGKWFAHEHWGIKPDIITFAKGITCGYVPLGGVIADKKIAEFFDTHYFSCGLTYVANLMGCATGLATMDVYEEENLLEESNRKGKILGSTLEDFKNRHKCVGDVRYIGLFSAAELVVDKETKEAFSPDMMKKVAAKLREMGVFAFANVNDSNLFINPPLIITDEQLKEALAIYDEALDYADSLL